MYKLPKILKKYEENLSTKNLKVVDNRLTNCQPENYEILVDFEGKTCKFLESEAKVLVNLAEEVVDKITTNEKKEMFSKICMVKEIMGGKLERLTKC